MNCALLNSFVLESVHQQLASVFAVRTDFFPPQTRTFKISLFFFFSHRVSLPQSTMSLKDNPCRKFQANIFNKSKCQNCFKPRESHLLNDEDLNQVNKRSSNFPLRFTLTMCRLMGVQILLLSFLFDVLISNDLSCANRPRSAKVGLIGHN